MQIGDLVTVKPAATGLYLILESPYKLPGTEKPAVLLYSCEEGWILPMEKRWIKMIQSL